jgi:drug/metabolite transporter (DMT)-like permease
MAGEGGANRRVAGIAVMLLAMLLFAGLDATNKHLSQGYAVAQMMLVRLVCFCALAVWLARRRLGVLVRSRRPWFQIARSLMLLVEMAAFVLALRYLPLADVHAIAAVSPLLVTALSLPLLGERVGARQWAAVIAAFIGILVIVRPGFAAFDWVVVFPLGGAALWALYQIMLRIAGRADAPQTTVLYTAFVGLVAIAPFGIAQWRAPSPVDWLLMLLSGVLGSAGHVAMTRAVVLCPPAVLQPFGYTLLVWAAVLGVIVFGQFPDAWTLTGAAIVVASGLYAWLAERAARPADAPAAAQ